MVCNIAMVKFEGGILNFTLALKLHQPKQNKRINEEDKAFQVMSIKQEKKSTLGLIKLRNKWKIDGKRC